MSAANGRSRSNAWLGLLRHFAAVLCGISSVLLLRLTVDAADTWTALAYTAPRAALALLAVPVAAVCSGIVGWRLLKPNDGFKRGGA